MPVEIVTLPCVALKRDLHSDMRHGYAIIANASPQARNPLLAKQQDLLFNIIPRGGMHFRYSDLLQRHRGVRFIVSGELMRRMLLRSEVSLRSKEASSLVGWESSLRFFCHWSF
jgi:hypothetical protein